MNHRERILMKQSLIAGKAKNAGDAKPETAPNLIFSILHCPVFNPCWTKRPAGDFLEKMSKGNAILKPGQ
jgi:hypothetical protein